MQVRVDKKLYEKAINMLSEANHERTSTTIGQKQKNCIDFIEKWGFAYTLLMQSMLPDLPKKEAKTDEDDALSEDS
jgi:hypothetical protein